MKLVSGDNFRSRSNVKVHRFSSCILFMITYKCLSQNISWYSLSEWKSLYICSKTITFKDQTDLPGHTSYIPAWWGDSLTNCVKQVTTSTSSLGLQYCSQLFPFSLLAILWVSVNHQDYIHSTLILTHAQPSFALLSLQSVDNEPEPIILSQWIERNRARNENRRANYWHSLMYNSLSLTPTLRLLSLSSLLFINYFAWGQRWVA